MNQDLEKIKNIDAFLKFSQELFTELPPEEINDLSQGLLQGKQQQQTWSKLFNNILSLAWLKQNYLQFSPYSKQKLQSLFTKILILIAANILIYLVVKSFWIYTTSICLLLSIYWIVDHFRNHKKYLLQLDQYQEIEKKIQVFDNPSFEGLIHLVETLLSPLFTAHSSENTNALISLEAHIFSFFPFTEEIRLPHFNLEGIFLNNQFMQWKIDVQNHIPQVHTDALLTFQESQMDIVGEFITKDEQRMTSNLKIILDFDAAENQYLTNFGETLEKVFIAFYLFFLMRAYPKQKQLEEHIFYQKLPPFSKFMIQVFHYVYKLQQSPNLPIFEVYETQEPCQYNYVKPFAPHKSQVYKSENAKSRLKRKEVIHYQVPILRGQVELSSQATAVIDVFQDIKESRFTRFTSDLKKIEIKKRYINHINYSLKIQYEKSDVRLNKNPTAILPNQQEIQWQVEETSDAYQIKVCTKSKSYSLENLPNFDLVEQVFKVGMSLVGTKI